MKILNLTQHRATKDQIDAGVINLPEEFREPLIEALTFDELPSEQEIENATDQIVALALEYLISIKDQFGWSFMIGGAPYLMPMLGNKLSKTGKVVFAFSKRVSQEVVQPDGSVKKTMVFKHEGFVPFVC